MFWPKREVVPRSAPRGEAPCENLDSEVVATDRLIVEDPGGGPGVADGALVDHVGTVAVGHELEDVAVAALDRHALGVGNLVLLGDFGHRGPTGRRGRLATSTLRLRSGSSAPERRF